MDTLLLIWLHSTALCSFSVTPCYNPCQTPGNVETDNFYLCQAFPLTSSSRPKVVAYLCFFFFIFFFGGEGWWKDFFLCRRPKKNLNKMPKLSATARRNLGPFSKEENKKHVNTIFFCGRYDLLSKLNGSFTYWAKKFVVDK